jgi:excisionase family DNA binding protein
MVKKLNESQSVASANGDPIAYSVEEVCQLAKICKQNVYNALNSGRLRGKKVGARTIILRSDLTAYMAGLDDYSPKAKEAGHDPHS